MLKKTTLLFVSVVPVFCTMVSPAFGATSPTSDKGASRTSTNKTAEARQLPTPPTGFDPLTASSSDLKKYGFPQRPTNPADLKAWTTAMQHAKIFEPVIVQPSNKTFTIYSQHWAGKADTGTSDFSDTHATWVLPSATEPLGSGAGDGQWVGMGGFFKDSAGIIQAGVDQSHGSDQFWYEVYPYQTAQYISGAYVNPGDTLYVDVTYSGPGNPDHGYANFYLEDETTNKVWRGPSEYVPTYYDGRSSEWVVEREGTNELADFGGVTFTSAGNNSGVYGGHTVEDGTYTCNYINLTSDGTSSGTLLAAPDSGDVADFTVHWYNYQ